MKRKYSYAELFMLGGSALAGAVAGICHAVTGRWEYFLFAGLAVAGGLAVGTALDRRRKVS